MCYRKAPNMLQCYLRPNMDYLYLFVVVIICCCLLFVVFLRGCRLCLPLDKQSNLPSVVKPSPGAGSALVKLVHDQAELKTFLETAWQLLHGHAYFVHWSIQGLVLEDKQHRMIQHHTSSRDVTGMELCSCIKALCLLCNSNNPCHAIQGSSRISRWRSTLVDKRWTLTALSRTVK